jgi:hypothetical protein
MKSTLKAAAVAAFITFEISAVGLVMSSFLVLQITPPALAYGIDAFPTRTNDRISGPVRLRVTFRKGDNDGMPMPQSIFVKVDIFMWHAFAQAFLD